MPNDTPAPGTNPGWGQPQPADDAPTAPWPADAAPAPAPWPTDASAPQPAPWPAPTQPSAPDSAGSWGAPPSSGTWGAPPQSAPQQPAAPAWGAPPPQSQPQPGWGAPPPQAPQQSAAPGWGAPPPQAPQQPAWGAPPPQAPQQPGWGAPPQQPGWGAPGAGGPPVGWAPAPQKSGGNGCLKACLIVAVIVVVLGIIAIVGVSILGMRFAEDMGINPDGSVKSCELVSNDQLTGVLPGNPQAMPMQGLVDATIGQLLDKRVLGDAPDCWLVTDESSVTGRLAVQGSGGSGAFTTEKSNAEAGGYFAKSVTGVGDEAFCTGVSEAMSIGVLARSGDKLVYVSLIDGGIDPAGLEATEAGVMYSAKTCDLAAQIAGVLLK